MDQNQINYLIGLEKIIENDIDFPQYDDMLTVDAVAKNGREKFLVDINRKGIFRLRKCTYQNRYAITEILVRLDINPTKLHRNPDGEIINESHIHIYKEGYGDSWAIPIKKLQNSPFLHTEDLVHTFLDFCRYCNIDLQGNLQGSVT